eukprot:Ihof_evm2s243 gene=Ihof_evmTU2s243
MADMDLDAIRAKRMAELQAQQAGRGNGGEKAQEAARAQQEQEMRNSLLLQILTQDARARLGRIKSVKPEKAQAVEELLIRMARAGQLPGKIDEPQLITLLDQVSNATNKKISIH